MVTMPLALLLGGLVFLGVRKMGWAAFPVVVAVVFGLVLGTTDIGGQLQGWISDASASLFRELGGSAR